MPFITDIQITSLSFPLAKPFSNHVRQITQIKGLNIKVITRYGIVGHGFIYGLSDMPYEEIAGLIENRVLPQLVTINCEIEDATQLMSVWKKIWLSLKPQQRSQSELTALAIVDIAIWDIFLKSENISLHYYFGGSQNKIPAYATTGWLSLSSEELVAECKAYQADGVHAFKIRLGHKDDVSRVRTVREAMGEQFTLMLDANQRYSLGDVKQVSNDFIPFNMLWLEEPTENKLEVIARVKGESVIPIALGENIIDEGEFIAICQNKLTDILQPDLPRCGGITGFTRVSDIALKYGIPVCNHLLHELSVSLVAAYKNGYMLECGNLLPPRIFTNNFEAKDGYIEPPRIPGNGVELTERALLHYAVITHTIQLDSKLKTKL